jgi:orotate phosphoribosyltransferase
MIDARNILNESGAILSGHFLLRSGKHSDTYVECAKTLQYVWHSRELGSEISLKLQRFAPDCIVSTETGIIIGYEVARNLDIPFIFAEIVDGKASFNHCLEPTMYKNLIIVEDLIADGEIIRNITLGLKEFNSEIIGVGSIVNMSQNDKIENVPVISLLNLPAKIFNPDECPMCKEGIELTTFKEPCKRAI